MKDLPGSVIVGLLNNKGLEEVQIPHGNNNTGHEVPAIPNMLRYPMRCGPSVQKVLTGHAHPSTSGSQGTTEKREITGIKSPSKIGRDRAHLLSGILKCPKCGDPMYTNKHAWTNKDGTYKEIYYYVCSKARTARGKSCNYKATLMLFPWCPSFVRILFDWLRHKHIGPSTLIFNFGIWFSFYKVHDSIESYHSIN
jgi:hypothetical protein